jgi:5'(3')-deoxyribonucleotidase
MKKILYVDMDNVLVDFQSGIDKTNEDVCAEYADRLDEVPGIFSLMKPLLGAVDAYKQLVVEFDTYILSTSPWENPSAWSDKLIWVKEYLGEDARKRLILTHNKDLNIGHFLVDDRLKNGADKFKGELLHFGTEKFPDWNAVLDYLIPKEGRHLT